MAQELESAKTRVSELQRRYEDASRAYEQERRVGVMVMCPVPRPLKLTVPPQERENRDERIVELQEGSKVRLTTPESALS